MANNSKKKVNGKNNGKGNNNYKKEVKRNNNKKEEIKVTEVKEEKVVSKKVEEKTKKSFSLTSRQKDIILVLLVVVLLVVGLILTSNKKPKLDIELPIALNGDAGYTEITYDQYNEKLNSEEAFLVVIVRDGCGYCEMYEPIVTEVADEYKLPIFYINLAHLTDEEKDSLSQSNSYLKRNKWGTPTTLFMYGSNVVDSISGYVEKDTFISFVKENFKVEE